MPRAADVTPAKWTAIQVLFDNGYYSLISGFFDEANKRTLGERWNGDGDSPGFPSQGGNPTWHVIPDFLVVPVLHGLLEELLRSNEEVNREYLEAIVGELRRQVS